MASTFENLSTLATFFPTSTTHELSIAETIYNENRHRLYALSFWMTDNELTAEELMQQAFCQAFEAAEAPSPELLDRTLITTLRGLMDIGKLTLACAPCSRVAEVRHNTKRVHLERAVVQLPATEKMIFLLHDVESYSHARVARYLGLTETETRHGLHQARLRVRELLAGMEQ